MEIRNHIYNVYKQCIEDASHYFNTSLVDIAHRFVPCGFNKDNASSIMKSLIDKVNHQEKLTGHEEFMMFEIIICCIHTIHVDTYKPMKDHKDPYYEDLNNYLEFVVSNYDFDFMEGNEGGTCCEI